MRVCCNCKQEKELTEFPKNKTEPQGYGYICKKCRKILYPYGKYPKTPIHYKRKYYQNRKEDIRIKDNLSRNMRDKTPKERYTDCKKQAEYRKYSFELTLEQFDGITKKQCIYCGEFTKKRKYSGVDRVNNLVGYVLTNCVPCCRVCNVMKNNLSVEEFYKHIEKIFLKRKENKNGIS